MLKVTAEIHSTYPQKQSFKNQNGKGASTKSIFYKMTHKDVQLCIGKTSLEDFCPDTPIWAEARWHEIPVGCIMLDHYCLWGWVKQIYRNTTLCPPEDFIWLLPLISTSSGYKVDGRISHVSALQGRALSLWESHGMCLSRRARLCKGLLHVQLQGVLQSLGGTTRAKQLGPVPHGTNSTVLQLRAVLWGLPPRAQPSLPPSTVASIFECLPVFKWLWPTKYLLE